MSSRHLHKVCVTGYVPSLRIGWW